MNIKTGDILIAWGKTKGARILRQLISLVFGEKDIATHVQIAVDNENDVSAESPTNSVRILGRARQLAEWRNYRVAIIRMKRMTDADRDYLKIATQKYLGRKYDWFLYVLWILRLSILFRPILHFILKPLYKWMNKEERKRFGCSELVATLLEDIGLGIGIEDATNVPPHFFWMLYKGCPDSWDLIYLRESK